jgi:hypothetical protein
MRLTINLEDDLYALARTIAKTEDCSISAAVNGLLRRSLERGRPARRPGSLLPEVPCRRSFTSDDVYRADLEDGAP